MKSSEGDFDFSHPCFKAYVIGLDEEYQQHVEDMLKDTFENLPKSEKLMIRPLIELHRLKRELTLLEELESKPKDEQKAQKSALEKMIKARLAVINENGDIHVLVKRFNIILIDNHKKKSSKSLAKMGAEAILSFVEALKASGELKH